MNDRFFSLNEEKQNKIINAAYKVFSRNDYRKAPMSEIADAGGISKALLFHYFENKLGLYMYLWEKACFLSHEAMEKSRVYEIDDFFEMLERSLLAKCELMRQYPYLSLFCIKAYYEEAQEVRVHIARSIEGAKEYSFATVASHLSGNGVRDGFTLEEVYQEVLYASDGYLQQQYHNGIPNPDKIEQEYSRMINLWRRAFGKTESLEK